MRERHAAVFCLCYSDKSECYCVAVPARVLALSQTPTAIGIAKSGKYKGANQMISPTSDPIIGLTTCSAVY